ncbi:sialidase-3-like [Labeo rohita]|uniref:sialidase-3-like n=1 Tax=Labeo rohita TaxID=84645 RepID=UPI0021E2D301|nr:sialidase-3-like [Labeo rohita]
MDNKTPSKSNSSSPNEINKTTIFKQEEPQTWFYFWTKQVSYRIPALVYLSDDRNFLAFAEKRKTLSDTDAEVLVMRRGTWKDATNQEVEWVSDQQLLTSACLPDHRSMNPCPVYERESKTLFLFFVCVPTVISERYQMLQNKNQAKLRYITSEDTGKTWSDMKDLTKHVIGAKEKNWATFAVGPGHGVQLKSGRLIIPAYAYNFDSTNEKPTSHAFTFYSDDNGHTWSTGDLIEAESNECQVAEIIDDSTLYCNARSKSGNRVEALSRSKGQEFDKASLPETGSGCQGSVLKFQNPDKSTWLLYSHPTDKKDRKNLGIYVNKSPLDLTQWNLKDTINNGPSGYSDLAECANREHIACLMECGEISENEEIAFKFVKISDTMDPPKMLRTGDIQNSSSSLYQ